MLKNVFTASESKPATVATGHLGKEGWGRWGLALRGKRVPLLASTGTCGMDQGVSMPNNSCLQSLGPHDLPFVPLKGA